MQRKIRFDNSSSKFLFSTLRYLVHTLYLLNNKKDFGASSNKPIETQKMAKILEDYTFDVNKKDGTAKSNFENSVKHCCKISSKILLLK